MQRIELIPAEPITTSRKRVTFRLATDVIAQAGKEYKEYVVFMNETGSFELYVYDAPGVWPDDPNGMGRFHSAGRIVQRVVVPAGQKIAAIEIDVWKGSVAVASDR